MPLFITCVRNSSFRVRDNGAEYTSAEVALTAGVHSAIMIAADEIGRGNSNSAVEISIELRDGTRILTSIVSISISPLIVGTDDERGPTATSNDDVISDRAIEILNKSVVDHIEDELKKSDD